MLRLRPYKSCDARYIVDWTKDEISFYQWSADRFQGFYPLSAEKLNEFYEKEAYNDSFFEMTAIDEKGRPAGHFIMRFIDQEKKTIRLGFVILDDRIRGRGLGKEMISMAFRIGKDFWPCTEMEILR